MPVSLLNVSTAVEVRGILEKNKSLRRVVVMNAGLVIMVISDCILYPLTTLLMQGTLIEES